MAVGTNPLIVIDDGESCDRVIEPMVYRGHGGSCNEASGASAAPGLDASDPRQAKG
jgi:hypothetical protein